MNPAAALPEIRVDPMRLEQALTEIVSNALDAMPDGGRLEIATRLEGAGVGANGVVIEISDSGGGIPPRILPTGVSPSSPPHPEARGLGRRLPRPTVREPGGRWRTPSAAA